MKALEKKHLSASCKLRALRENSVIFWYISKRNVLARMLFAIFPVVVKDVMKNIQASRKDVFLGTKAAA